jgi:hypothetical protein
MLGQRCADLCICGAMQKLPFSLTLLAKCPGCQSTKYCNLYSCQIVWCVVPGVWVVRDCFFGQITSSSLSAAVKRPVTRVQGAPARRKMLTGPKIFNAVSRKLLLLLFSHSLPRARFSFFPAVPKYHGYILYPYMICYGSWIIYNIASTMLCKSINHSTSWWVLRTIPMMRGHHQIFYWKLIGQRADCGNFFCSSTFLLTALKIHQHTLTEGWMVIW